MINIVSERVTAHVEVGCRWPLYSLPNSEILELKKGNAYNMSFRSDSQCLLYQLAFNIIVNITEEEYFGLIADGERIHVTLVVSIEKTKVDKGNVIKTKVFVGTGTLISTEPFLMSMTLPDIIIIEGNTNYELEIIPFQSVKICCFNNDLKYSENDTPKIDFDGLNFALMKLNML